jgi:hypothetical protein
MSLYEVGLETQHDISDRLLCIHQANRLSNPIRCQCFSTTVPALG